MYYDDKTSTGVGFLDRYQARVFVPWGRFCQRLEVTALGGLPREPSTVLILRRSYHCFHAATGQHMARLTFAGAGLAANRNQTACFSNTTSRVRDWT
jgi:hypothetical protein